MDYEIIMRPEFALAITSKLALLMQRLSSMHYDGRCKAAGQPGPGGFINGWVNWTSGGEDAVMVTATPRELDTAMKIMEMPPPLDAGERALLLDLRFTIVTAMRAAGVWK